MRAAFKNTMKTGKEMKKICPTGALKTRECKQNIKTR
jgi:hypothetical protein